jgi:hypothetical protein
MGSDLELRHTLRRYRQATGFLASSAIDPHGDDMARLRRVLEDNYQYQGLMSVDDSFELILDTGCTRSSTFDQDDFIPGTLKPLEQPLVIDGIAGGLTVTHEGQIRYEVIDNNGDIQALTTQAFSHQPYVFAFLVHRTTYVIMALKRAACIFTPNVRR